MSHIHDNCELVEINEYVFCKLVQINIVQSWSISRLAWLKIISEIGLGWGKMLNTTLWILMLYPLPYLYLLLVRQSCQFHGWEKLFASFWVGSYTNDLVGPELRLTRFPILEAYFIEFVCLGLEIFRIFYWHKKMYGPNLFKSFFESQIFWTLHFLWTQHFFDQTFFLSKIFLHQKLVVKPPTQPQLNLT